MTPYQQAREEWEALPESIRPQSTRETWMHGYLTCLKAEGERQKACLRNVIEILKEKD